jgi:tetratricopeptide (TPR) repeat protein
MEHEDGGASWSTTGEVELVDAENDEAAWMRKLEKARARAEAETIAAESESPLPTDDEAIDSWIDGGAEPRPALTLMEQAIATAVEEGATGAHIVERETQSEREPAPQLEREPAPERETAPEREPQPDLEADPHRDVDFEIEVEPAPPPFRARPERIHAPQVRAESSSDPDEDVDWPEPWDALLQSFSRQPAGGEAIEDDQAPSPPPPGIVEELERARRIVREIDAARPTNDEPTAEVAELATLLRTGRLVLCAGPRLVAAGRTFTDLIARLLGTLPAEETAGVRPLIERRPLAAAGFVRRRLGAQFADALRAASAPEDGNGAADLVRRLGALPFRAVVTTGYDDLLEQAFAGHGRPLRVYTPGEANVLRQDGKQPFILKAFGCATRAETLVWSSEDLQSALASAEFRAAAHELYRSRSFLFVGFERGDLDLEILLERVLSGAAEGAVEHFAVMPELTAIEQEELSRAWRIRVLPQASVDALVGMLEAALAAPACAHLPEADDLEGWLALIADNPQHTEANDYLDRLATDLREREDYDGLVELVLLRVEHEPEPSQRAARLLAVSRVFEHEADDPARALTTLLAAYKEDPSAAAWHELERLADAARGWDELPRDYADLLPRLPAEVRVALWRRLGRWSELAQALDERIAEARQQGGADEDVRALRRETALVYADQLDERPRAIAIYEELLDETPDDLELLQALERVYDLSGRQEDLRRTLARRAELTRSEVEQAALFRRLALAWEDEPDGAAHAASWWEKLTVLEPEAEDALRALERVHRIERKWPELIEALRRRAVLADPPVQAELYAHIGELYERELQDLDNALEAYRLADAAGSRAETRAALVRLYEQTGAIDRALALLDEGAERAQRPAEQISFLFRAGQLCGDLRDPRGAEARFARVLELDPSYAPAMVALAEIYKQNGEYLRAGKLLADAVPHTANRLARTRLLVNAGEMYDRVDDGDTAVEKYLLALAEDPEHVHAAERAADLLWSAERFADLVPVLEMLSRKPAPEALQVARLVRLGHAAASIDARDKADKAYARAAELDPANFEAQRRRAEYYIQQEEWQKALSALDRVFQYHIDALTPAEHVELFSQMGRCELMLGAREAARELLLRALELDPTHRPSLLAQIELADDPRAQIEAKRALLAAASPDERFKLLGEIGELHLTRLQEPSEAIAAFNEALAIRPDDHRLLHRVLDGHVERSAWPEALGVLERLTEVEKDDAVRARYRLTAALICRDELARRDLAGGHLRAALDDDPGLERASTALEQLYAAEENWRELARLYRGRLKRLGPESPADADGKNLERLRVWSALGDLCWEKLGDRESAQAALEVALSFDRDNVERHKRLADLYVQLGPATFGRSIAAHQRVLAGEKGRVLSMRALKHLYIQTQQREKALMCACALELLQKGDDHDARKVAAYRQRPFATARGVLNDESWARLQHPDEDRLLGQLLGIVGGTVAAGQALPHKAFELVREDALAADDAHSYAKVLRYVAHVLDVPVPEAYVRPEQREPVVFANCLDGAELVPVVLLGAPLVGDRRSHVEQVFELARVLAHLRPERLLRLATPHPHSIAHVIEAAMALGAEIEGEPEATDVVGRTVLGLKRALPPIELERVAAIGVKLRALGSRPDAAALRWLQAADLTGLRAGWALVGDLSTCARLVAAEGQPAGTLPPKQRLLELVWSTMTEEMFAVRRALGLM